MKGEITLTKSFSFEAAHSIDLPDGTNEGYKRLHGHSFSGKLILRGNKEDIDKWLIDFGVLDPVIDEIREHLDHSYLNDIEGLKYSTLENLCVYIYNLAKPMVECLAGVELSRPTCGQTCTFIAETL